ncbi:putative importin-9 [Apostichopus japonicus]|uniref:Putative importin-9 n=1 Tax=Stichopus japonicus TaxID=307972 RepID=A0A2G8LF04_STIJA|nr:putative importin-9 [Apostichopus japonicus]
MSPDQNVRLQGEDQLKVLEVTDAFGVHLAEFTVDTNSSLAIRQLSSLILKQYVEAHWCHLSEKFRPPEATPEAKAAIRNILPAGLQESISKLRSCIAYAISAIAHWDWPEEWPELFQYLIQLLAEGSPHAVHGAMRVLTEFSREVTDTQMPHVAPLVLPQMYRIFIEANLYGIRTRGRAVEIFNTCCVLIHSIDVFKQAKDLLFPYLPKFAESFVQALSVADGDASDSGLKTEVIKAITTLVKTFPGQMSKFMTETLPAIWKCLTDCADTYVKTAINNIEEADNAIDSDGEVLGFENLVFSIFDFIHALTETNKNRAIVKKHCADILYYVVLYMQITEEQVSLWTSDPNQFVEDEDDDTFSYSVRISSQDLLLTIASEFPQVSAPALVTILNKHIDESRSTNSKHWWKVHESCMLAVGSVKSLIIDKASKGKLAFDVQSFLTTVVLNDLKSGVSPFLCGRALWTASRFSQAMSPELVHQFLEASVAGLLDTQPPSVRISAVRAVFGFCEQLKVSESTSILLPFLEPILIGLVQLATQYGQDILALVLETIGVVLTIDENFTATVEPKVGPLSIALFLKYSDDPLIASLTQDILRELTSTSGCRDQIQARLLPTLISILRSTPDKVPMGLQSAALDVICTTIRCNPVPLPDAFLNDAFPVVVQCVMNSDDNAVMQSGGECVRAFISVSYDQLANWKDGSGNGGLKYTVQVISKLLDPSNPEYAAAFIGRLVAILISKAGSVLGEDIEMMLRMVLSKMQQSETMSVMQSLIMVYAHLMHSQISAVLEFLYSVPGPTGKPALEFVLVEWVSRHVIFYGAYDSKVSITALSKLLQHSIATSDNRLDGIEVKGDQVFNENEGIRTRSKAANMPEHWTMIPIAVKIYKLLINDLSIAMETTTSKQASAGDLEDDGWEDEDDDIEDEDEVSNDNGLQLPEFALASEYPGYDFAGLEDEEDDDPDALQDPLFELDVQAYLTHFLQELSRHPYHSEFQKHLNPMEMEVLKCIGIPG